MQKIFLEKLGGESNAFAEIHLHDGVTSQAIATGTTYTLFTEFTNNGVSGNCTPDVTNNKITITKRGVYKVDGSFSFFSGTNSVTFKLAPFLGGVEQDQIHFERKVSVASDKGSASITGLINVESVPVDIDIRIRHDNGSSVDFTASYANLNVSFMGII